MFHPVVPDRHWVAVSLAEAATVRRVLHIGNNSERNNGGGGKNEEKNGAFNVLKGANIALRYSPLATPGAETKGDGGLLFDVSAQWRHNNGHNNNGHNNNGHNDNGHNDGHNDDCSASSAHQHGHLSTGAPKYQAASAHNSFRFFDCDTHYSDEGLRILIRSLQTSTVRLRERFFTTTVGHRRRMVRRTLYGVVGFCMVLLDLVWCCWILYGVVGSCMVLLDLVWCCWILYGVGPFLVWIFHV